MEEEIQMYTNEVDPLWRRASLGLKRGDSVHLWKVFMYTVKLVLRGHLWNKEKVAF